MRLLNNLWKDDAGAIIAMEYLLIATILVIGIVVGLTSVRAAINAEMAELANAYLALSQGYVLSGLSGCCSATDGSQAIDTPGLVPCPILTPPAIPKNSLYRHGSTSTTPNVYYPTATAPRLAW